MNGAADSARGVFPCPPSGTWIWIPDTLRVWRRAKFLERLPRSSKNVKDNVIDLHVEHEDGSTDSLSLPEDTPFYLCNVETNGTGTKSITDLAALPHLHEAEILQCLESRFASENIYTFTGPILLAVNPFKFIPGLYDSAYLKATVHAPVLPNEPHVYLVASRAIRNLCLARQSQTVLISGESGAGKTESTKHVMRCLALAGSPACGTPGRRSIEHQVLQSNPLLESLGNATTLRNHNSSRFGKFVEMQFAEVQNDGVVASTRLTGASIQTYLLETVRVCRHTQGERNYHIFYQLCAAASWARENNSNGRYLVTHRPSPDSFAEHHLPNDYYFDLSAFEAASCYNYLAASDTSICSTDDREQFDVTVKAMQAMGLSAKDQENVFQVLGAILCLGNISFDVCPSDDTVVIKPCSKQALITACRGFLGVSDEHLLEKGLTHRFIRAAGETISKPLTLREAEDNRDALAKALYGSLFRTVVDLINAVIGSSPDGLLSCGVLDIFGFECFDVNSFEQLCINYTNERLQSVFNTFIFQYEQQLYQEQGVPWVEVSFPDNQHCLQLLEHKTTGVLALLEEECILPQPSDRRLLNKLKDKHKCHTGFDAVPTFNDRFIINHFAGPVTYIVDGFVDKNSARLSLELHQTVLTTASNPFVRSFLRQPEYAACAGKAASGSKRAVTVSCTFRQQLHSLIETLNATTPHFIRCIKPNAQNVPDSFDRRMVAEQLRYSGVVQAVYVSRMNFPVRLPHREAYNLYRALARSAVNDGQPSTEGDRITDASFRLQVASLFEALEAQGRFQRCPLPPAGGASPAETEWAVGTSFVFLKQHVYGALEDARVVLYSNAQRTIRRYWMGHKERRAFRRVKQQTVRIQAWFRCRRKRQQWCITRTSLVLIQRNLRAWLARQRYRRLKEDVLRLQATVRRRQTAVQLDRDKHRAGCVLRIQAFWRGYRARRQLQRTPKAVGLLQQPASSVVHPPIPSQETLLKHENDALKTQLERVKKELETTLQERDSLIKQLNGSPPTLSTTYQTSITRESSYAADDSPFAPDELRTLQPFPQPLTATPNTTPSLEPASASAPRFLSPFPKLGRRVDSWTSRSVIIDILVVGNGLQLPAKDGRSSLYDGLEHLDGETFACREASPSALSSVASEEGLDALHASLKTFRFDGHHWIVGYFNTSATHIHEDPAAFSAWARSPLYVLLLYDPDEPTNALASLQWISFYTAPTARRAVWRIARTERPSPSEELVQRATALHIPVLAADTLFSALKQLISFSSQATSSTSSGQHLPTTTTVVPLGIAAEIPSYFSAVTRSIPNAWSSFMQLFNDYWDAGPAERRYRSPSGSRERLTVLEPSLPPESLAHVHKLLAERQHDSPRSASVPDGVVHGVHPVVELQAPQSRITCMCFDRTRSWAAGDGDGWPYHFLAAGFSDGWIRIHKVFWTPLEKAAAAQQLRDPAVEHPPLLRSAPALTASDSCDGLASGLSLTAFGQRVDVHWEHWGHRDAVTDLLFYSNACLVSAGADGYIRVWDMLQGKSTTNFHDASGCNAVAFFPQCPSLMVVANASHLMRVVDITTGRVLQRVRMDHTITALAFNDAGHLCFAGSSEGRLLVLEASPVGSLQLKHSISVTKTAITSLSYVTVRSATAHPPCVLVTARNSGTSIVECYFYATQAPGDSLRRLSVRQHIVTSNASCPQRSCHLTTGEGWFVCPGDGGKICLISMTSRRKLKIGHNKIAQVTVAAVNPFGTVLATGDDNGRLLLWRSFASTMPEPE